MSAAFPFDDAAQLAAQLLARRWLPRSHPLVRRALIDTDVWADLGQRLAAVGLKVVDAAALVTALRDDHGTVIGWQRGPVLGVYAHGLFESAAVMRALFGAEVATLEASLDRLADLVDRHFEPGVLNRCLRA